MKKIIFALALVTSLTFLSCEKEDETPESTGISTGNYWPMALNNTWNFNGNGMDSQMKIVGTKNIGGKNYFELDDNVNTEFDVKSYILKDGGVYFMRSDKEVVETDGLVITIDGYEIPFLKDNLMTDAIWEGNTSAGVKYVANGQTTNTTANFKYKGLILATDATETYNGVTYTDVIKMRMRIELTILGQTSDILVEYDFAKDVGPIKTYEVGNGMSIDRKLTSFIVN